MSMREYEEVKNIVIPKEQEEMMDIICDAWEECRASESCKNCPDRPQTYMRMMMCTALKYTRRLIEAGYAKRQAADVAPVRHGRWIEYMKVIIPEPYNKWEQAWKCSECGFDDGFIADHFCPNCGARMDGDAEAQQPHGIDAFIDACPKCSNRNSELCDECRCEKRGAFLPENKPSKRNAADAAEHKTIRERFEAVFPRCRIDEYGEPAEICPASLAGKECPATDKPTCMNCPAWDWPAE